MGLNQMITDVQYHNPGTGGTNESTSVSLIFSVVSEWLDTNQKCWRKAGRQTRNVRTLDIPDALALIHDPLCDTVLPAS